MAEKEPVKRRPKSGLEVISQVRRGILDAMYSEDQQHRYIKRQVVENLLGVLSAARSSGIGWDEMAKICADYGFEISPKTLKSYYVDLKEERESNIVRRQAKEIVTAKKDYELKRELQNGSTDAAEAKRKAQNRLSNKPKLLDPGRLRDLEASNEQPEKTASKPTEPVKPVQQPTRKKSSQPVERESASAAKQELATTFDQLGPGQGKTIDQLEIESKLVETATILYEDIILTKDGRVYFESGKPFTDLLSLRQVKLLRIKNRYFKNGSTDARSSKSVVKMSNKL